MSWCHRRFPKARGPLGIASQSHEQGIWSSLIPRVVGNVLGGCVAEEQTQRSVQSSGPPTAAVSLEEALIPFVFHGAANSRWSQDLLVRKEEPQGDDLDVYVYRNV